MAKVAHLKEPEKEGTRESIYFATHADYVEGLNDKLEKKCDLSRFDGQKINAKIWRKYRFSLHFNPIDKNSNNNLDLLCKYFMLNYQSCNYYERKHRKQGKANITYPAMGL